MSATRGRTGTQAKLRTGWTTGACAAAAAKGAAMALFTGRFPETVSVRLPGGQTPVFSLTKTELGADWAMAGVIKDAGDDPDVTHGALICARLWPGEPGNGVQFLAGPGVGTVTRPGLPIPPGEPAINPVPRQMIQDALKEVAQAHDGHTDLQVEISVPEGERLAEKTLNPRLGIVGGISILGTTGIVVPYSCSAWIHALQRGIDVARASGLTHLVASVGATSEAMMRRRYPHLPDMAFLEMGDFVGGVLKYLKRHPLPRLSLAGGFAKISKLACGALDLHSRRGGVNLPWLADALASLEASPQLVSQAKDANTALEILTLAQKAGLPLADHVATCALATCRKTLGKTPVALEVLISDRQGNLVGFARETHSPPEDTGNEATP